MKLVIENIYQKNNMSFENFKPEPVKKKIENPTVEDRLGGFLDEIFDNNVEAVDRFNAVSNRLGALLDSSVNSWLQEDELNNLKNNLRDCCELDNKDEFIEKCFIVFKPLIDWYYNNPREFEAALRINALRVNKFTPLNEVLTYGRWKDIIHIHVAVSETLSLGEKLAMMKDGFYKLAEMLRNDDSIKTVSATSWIVAANPGILEKWGFEILGEISPELREKHFKKEKRIVFEARATRDNFLTAIDKDLNRNKK